MQRRNKLIPYSLKLEKSEWDVIDRNRLSMVGLLSPQGITKVDYIRNALSAYNEYFETQIMPKVKTAKNTIEDPLPIYIDNGVDVGW